MEVGLEGHRRREGILGLKNTIYFHLSPSAVWITWIMLGMWYFARQISPCLCGLSKIKLISCSFNHFQSLSNVIAWNCHFPKFRAFINLQYLFFHFRKIYQNVKTTRERKPSTVQIRKQIRKKKHRRGICIHSTNSFDIYLMNLIMVEVLYNTQG